MKNLLTIVFICLTSLFGAVNLSLENVDTNAGTLSVIMENDETVGEISLASCSALATVCSR